MQRRPRHPRDDVGVAVVAPDLLDDVDLLGRVRPPRRQRHVHDGAGPVDGVADRVEQPGQVAGREVGAEDAVDVGDAHGAASLPRRQGVGAGVDRSGVHHQVGARLAEQLDEAGDAAVDAIGVDAALEPRRGVAAQAGPRHRGGDPVRLEPRALERHGGRGVGDLAVGAAHDPGQPDRHIVGVADEQVGFGEHTVDAVEGGEALPRRGVANPEAAAAQGVEVVGVVRLVQLEHDVVAHVDHVVDRALTGREQPVRHPRRARNHADSRQHDGGEARARIAGDDVDQRAALGRRPATIVGSGTASGRSSHAARSRATPRCP